ncbi:MAG: amidase [Flavobacteriaceae bacterium]|nr:amidase [Flavobacteriaceae bacterium]|tara:strand:- start:1113 stop:1874 length:762 start_codon:yes stop_codon:yes gene_type:complete
MRPYILSECSWKALKTKRFDLAVLPWGATEAHNYHLPYGTDVYEADAIAEAAGKKAWEKGAKVVVLPTVPFGVNTGQTDIYLDINMSPSTQLSVLKDVLTVLERQGIQKFLILNSHGGNDFKTLLRELGMNFPKMFLSYCNWFQALDKSKYFEEDGDHADEMETSIMMHIKPHLVLPLSEAGSGKEKKNTIKGFQEKWAWSERKWSLVTKDTGVGNPKKSTAEKGKMFFEDVTDKISELIQDLCNTNIDQLYK